MSAAPNPEGGYRDPPRALPEPGPAAPPERRSWVWRLLCTLGVHEGPLWRQRPYTGCWSCDRFWVER